MSKIQSGGFHFAKKSDDLTWNDPRKINKSNENLSFEMRYACISAQLWNKMLGRLIDMYVLYQRKR